MILTGEKLAEIGEAVWGKDWKSVLGRRLDLTRQTIHAKSKSKTGLPKAFKRELLAALDEQLVMTSNAVDQLRQDAGAL